MKKFRKDYRLKYKTKQILPASLDMGRGPLGCRVRHKEGPAGDQRARAVRGSTPEWARAGWEPPQSLLWVPAQGVI